MSFALNDVDSEQLSLFDSFNSLTEREKKYLDRSWAKYFAEYIFPKIDETPYALLYSTKDSRPNTPVNIQVGALLIKELTGMSDDEIMNALMFDVRYQYALHTTSYAEQPLNDRTLGRFRQRCATFEEETGIDLLHNTITSLSKEMAEIMNINMSLKRMDSMMVESNIKRMSRLEILYTCVAHLAAEVLENKKELPESLLHYTEKDDRNRVIYHNKSEQTADKISTILRDAKTLKELCGSEYDESSHYQLLLRALKEQAVEQKDGSYRLRTKEDGGMDSSILQNPADPDATYREKAGKEHRGYVANVTEASGKNGSIVTDYQYEENTYSDSQFLKDAIETMGKQDEKVTVVTDGAYPSEEALKMAEASNIEVKPTNLTGKKVGDYLTAFEYNEEGTAITKCAGGFEPKSSSYDSKCGKCTAKFEKSQCENCKHFKECHPTKLNHVYRKIISANTKWRAEQQKNRSSEEFKTQSAFRNGVETIPSIMRRKYNVDKMPVRGKLRTKMLFGCKIGALNIKKFCKYMQDRDNCAQNAVMA